MLYGFITDWMPDLNSEAQFIEQSWVWFIFQQRKGKENDLQIHAYY